MTNEEYVRYNGIPHRVLPREEPTKPQDTKSAVEKSLEVMRVILNPEDAYYILGDTSKQQTEEGKLIARSAASTEKKKFTAQDQLELQRMILG